MTVWIIIIYLTVGNNTFKVVVGDMAFVNESQCLMALRLIKDETVACKKMEYL